MSITENPVWHALEMHRQRMAGKHMRELFSSDPTRFPRLSLDAADLFLDFSKNRVDDETLRLLFELARAAGLAQRIEAMFRGDRINNTENRAVLHTALRNAVDNPVLVDGTDVMPQVDAELRHMREFTDAVRDGVWRGHGGARITDVVNIGIGGSHLGPYMAVEALRAGTNNGPRVHFVANVDDADIGFTLARLHPESTLFLVVSKTFTTQETATNAATAREWLLDHFRDNAAVSRHFVAVSTNLAAVQAFGIDPKNTFTMWDWVGGRYSLWSAVGLSIALAVGMEDFRHLLAGAHAMDRHFREAPFERNMPVIMALLGIWYADFLDAASHCVVPYDERLRHLPAYLQQLDMESNGKRVSREGAAIGARTGPILWGNTGTNSQHAFFQLLHQGTHLIPVDFLLAARSEHGIGRHHDMLAANCLAQAEALMRGRSSDDTAAEMRDAGIDAERIAELVPHRSFPGNRPSNLLLYPRLDAATLGRIIALYEHKVFVQGVIWNVNSFDQWGVELGKQLAGTILNEIDGARSGAHDSSTAGLIARYRSMREK
jgi:glucose-6-phosphate isomerase